MNYDNVNDELQNSDFEPQIRGRANTWHGPGVPPTQPASQLQNYLNESCESPCGEKNASATKKLSTSRRNAWGNMSYSDLIMQAIESSADKRLTLVQIYSWMIQNVPYFQEKSDGPSSVGWKNSIRHNLSLHPQFMRQPNDKTGKSSWWIINHSAIKPSRSRRTNIISEANRNKFCLSSASNTSQPCESISESGEIDVLQSYLPSTSENAEFRSRTYSNPLTPSNLTRFVESDMQMKRRASDEIDDDIAAPTGKMRPRAPTDIADMYKTRPYLFHQYNTKPLSEKFTDEDESRKELELFIPSGHFNLFSKSQCNNPNIEMKSTAVAAKSLQKNFELDLEKVLLFQLMKSDKITKLRKKNPEFERRLCDAIHKKKQMILKQQQQMQKQQILLNMKPIDYQNLESSNGDYKSSTIVKNSCEINKLESNNPSCGENNFKLLDSAGSNLLKHSPQQYSNLDLSLPPLDPINPQFKNMDIDNSAYNNQPEVQQFKDINLSESYGKHASDMLRASSGDDNNLPQFSADFESLLQLDSDNLLTNILNLDLSSLVDLNLDFM